MARRLLAEKPYTPLDDSLLTSVLSPAAQTPAAEHQRPGGNALSIKTGRRPRRQPTVEMSLEDGVHPASIHAEHPVADEAPDQHRYAPRRVLSPERHAASERMEATLRLKVAIRDKREFEAFTARLAIALNTTLKPSNLLRAMLTVMQNSEPSLNELARREPPLKRPANDDVIAYADFEHRIVRVLDAAVRRSPALR